MSKSKRLSLVEIILWAGLGAFFSWVFSRQESYTKYDDSAVEISKNDYE